MAREERGDTMAQTLTSERARYHCSCLSVRYGSGGNVCFGGPVSYQMQVQTETQRLLNRAINCIMAHGIV